MCFPYSHVVLEDDTFFLMLVLASHIPHTDTCSQIHVQSIIKGGETKWTRMLNNNWVIVTYSHNYKLPQPNYGNCTPTKHGNRDPHAKGWTHIRKPGSSQEFRAADHWWNCSALWVQSYLPHLNMASMAGTRMLPTCLSHQLLIPNLAPKRTSDWLDTWSLFIQLSSLHTLEHALAEHM